MSLAKSPSGSGVLLVLLWLAGGCGAGPQPPSRFFRRRVAPPQQGPDDVIPRVICTERELQALFRPGVRAEMLVIDRSGVSIPVQDAPEQCGVRVSTGEGGAVSVSSDSAGCFVRREADALLLVLGVQLVPGGLWYWVNVSCPVEETPQDSPRGRCDVPEDLQVACGPRGVSPAACARRGCCYTHSARACFHRLDDCTQDGQFVFTVRRRDAEPPLDLSGVRVEGHEECAPLVTTPEALVFRFGVTECGARRDEYGQVLRFQVELVAVPGVSRLEYGPVSRDSPYRLLIECQYRQSVLVQAGLTALDPTPPKPASALGRVRVEMRIAKDSSFSSFFPADRLPLSLPLREPLFVEVRVRDPPDPRISLRIRDCFAYPASRHSLWVLLYDGCPNPLDSEFPSAILGEQQVGRLSHYRRFDVKTFSFIDPKTGEPSSEEVYFYCWVEICAADSDRCRQQCVQSRAQSDSESDRLRRDFGSDPVSQLVLMGPVLLGNQPEIFGPAEKSGSVHQVLSVYSLAAVCSAAVCLFLFSALAGFLLYRQAARRLDPAGQVVTEATEDVLGPS